MLLKHNFVSILEQTEDFKTNSFAYQDLLVIVSDSLLVPSPAKYMLPPQMCQNNCS